MRTKQERKFIERPILKMKKSNLKVLFYTNTLRAFRSNLIGYLYEICQLYPVILLSEKLDPKTEKIIK